MAEDETTWLRFRLRRLRAILRLMSGTKADYALAETALRELIAEAEARLEALERQ